MHRNLVRWLTFAACLAAPSLGGCTDLAGVLLSPGGIGSTSSSGGLSIITNADPSSKLVSPGDQVTLSVRVTSGTGSVTYAWSASGGSLSSSSGNPVVWTAPSAPGNYSIQVTVSDGTNEAPGAFGFTVQ